MARVIFTIQYEVFAEKREEYLKVARELKNIVRAEGLQEYSIFETEKKKNQFSEQYSLMKKLMKNLMIFKLKE